MDTHTHTREYMRYKYGWNVQTDIRCVSVWSSTVYRRYCRCPGLMLWHVRLLKARFISRPGWFTNSLLFSLSLPLVPGVSLSLSIALCSLLHSRAFLIVFPIDLIPLFSSISCSHLTARPLIKTLNELSKEHQVIAFSCVRSNKCACAITQSDSQMSGTTMSDTACLVSRVSNDHWSRLIFKIN